MPETIISAVEGRVRCEHRRVAIIGAGATRNQAPWSDDSICWWAINEIWQKRYDRHFELHPMAVQSPRDFAFLAKCLTPCYVLDYADARNLSEIEYHGAIFPGVANAVEYPLDWVLKTTGGRRYVTCTFAMQLGLAIAEGFEEIQLWGVDLARGTLRERLVEAPCVEYWVGVAEGRGITVTAPESSTLCRQPYLYGYDYDAEVKAVDTQCDEAVMTLKKDRWPAVLHRLGIHYGGETEREMIHAALALGKAPEGVIEPDEWEYLNALADRVAARRANIRKAFEGRA